MRTLMKSVLAPLMSIAVLMLSTGFLMTYISVRLNAADMSETVIGWVQAAFYFGFLIGGVRIEPLVRRVGHIRAFAVCACLSTGTILAQGLWFSAIAWFALRLIAGVCIAAMYVVIESWLLSKGTQQNRGRILALYMIALYSSQAVSQFFIDLVQIDTTQAFMISGILMSLSVVPVAWTYSSGPEPEEPTSAGLFHLLRLAPFGVMGCVIGGVILSSIYSFAPIFAEDKGLPVSWVMSITITGGFLLQWPIGHLSDFLDRRSVLIATSFAVIAPALGVYVLPSHPLILLALSFVLGGLCFALYPISITSVCDRVQPSDVTAATGVLLIAYGTGAILGPIIAPPFLVAFGSGALYPFIAVSAGVLGVIGVVSWVYRPRVPMDEQNDYVPLAPVTPVAYELDPRILDEEEEGRG
jgi:MFS family permease